MPTYQRFEDLPVWQEAIVLAYNDAFMLISAIAALALAGLLAHLAYLQLRKPAAPIAQPAP